VGGSPVIENGKQLAKARLALGMSLSDLADALRMGIHGERNLRRWEKDEVPIPGAVCVAVEAMLDGYVPEYVD